MPNPEKTSSDEELKKAIGTVTIAFSSLDFLIVSFAGQLLSTNARVGHTLFGPMQMSRKIEMLATLFELLPDTAVGVDTNPKTAAVPADHDHHIEPITPAKRKELDAILARAKAVAERRNMIMHALLWYKDDEVDGHHAIFRVKGSGLAHHPMPVSTVEELATEIDGIVRDLEGFRSRHLRYSGLPWEPHYGQNTLWWHIVIAARMPLPENHAEKDGQE